MGATWPSEALGGFWPSVSGVRTRVSPGCGGRDDGTGPRPVLGSQVGVWPKGQGSRSGAALGHLSCWSVPPEKEPFGPSLGRQEPGLR